MSNVIVSVLVALLAGVTGATLFFSNRYVKKAREEAEEAMAEAKKSEYGRKAEEAESSMASAGMEVIKKIYKAKRVLDESSERESLIGADASTWLTDEEKENAKKASKYHITSP